MARYRRRTHRKWVTKKQQQTPESISPNVWCEKVIISCDEARAQPNTHSFFFFHGIEHLSPSSHFTAERATHFLFIICILRSPSSTGEPNGYNIPNNLAPTDHSIVCRFGNIENSSSRHRIQVIVCILCVCVCALFCFPFLFFAIYVPDVNVYAKVGSNDTIMWARKLYIILGGSIERVNKNDNKRNLCAPLCLVPSIWFEEKRKF